MELSLELGCQRESILGVQKHAKVKNGGTVSTSIRVSNFVI